MKKQNWEKILSLMLCVAMMLSMNMQAIALTIDDIELTPKASVVKSDAQVQAVIDKIDAIGTVEYTDECLEKIVAAESAYSELSKSQKEQVENYGVLVAARQVYNALAADKVDTSGYLITDIGFINSTVKWYVYSNGVLEISGTGSVPSYSSNAPWQKYVSSIKTIIVRSSITSIGASAFGGCNNVTSITLPFVGASRTIQTNIANGYMNHFGYIFGAERQSGNNTYYASTPPYKHSVNEYLTNYHYAYYYSVNINSGSYYYDYYNFWSFNIPSSLKAVTITDANAIGDCAFKNTSFTSITLNDSISSIGNYAFFGCSSLQDYAIPNNVSTIGQYAFCSNASLTEIYIPDGVTKVEPYTFYGCNKISRLAIGKNVTSIGDYAFYNNALLTKLVIPENTNSIGSYTFANCTEITDINIPDKVTLLGTYVFSGDDKVTSLKIGSGVKTIPSYAFQNCTGLTTITVPDSVTAINEYAFSNCSNLTSITLPFVGASRTLQTGIANGYMNHIGYIFGGQRLSSFIWVSTSGSSNKLNDYYPCYHYSYFYAVNSYYSNTDYQDKYYYWDFNIPSSLKTVIITDATAIGNCAFKNTSFTSITLNDRVSSIRDYAFYGCSSLVDYAFPNSVLSIGKYAFYNNTSLTEIYIPDGVTKVEPYTFYGCNKISRLVIGKNVTSIGGYAFYENSALTKLIIPEKTDSIGSYAFANCTGITEIDIPNKVSSLGTYVFSGNNKVTSLKIGSGIKTIPSYAFQNCTGLTTITVPDTVTTINKAAFAGCNNVKGITLPFVGASRTLQTDVSNGYMNHFGYIFGAERQSGSNTYYNSSAPNKHSVNEYATNYHYAYYYSVNYKSGSYYYDYYYYWSFNIPSSLTNVTVTNANAIGDCAFKNTSFTSITVNDSLTSVGAYAFRNVPWYTNLNKEFNTVGDGVLIKFTGNKSSISFPETVKYIGAAVFENNTTISKVTITDQITGIGALAFNGCSNLTSITIPKTVTCIGTDAIPSSCVIRVYCPSAGYDYRSTNREILNSWYTTGQDTFYYVIDDNDLVEIIGTTTTSTEITVPEEIDGKIVQRIGDYGFANCTTLNSITITANIKSIGKNAFDGCTSLINATIPTTVDSVGDYAFNNCTNLKNVTISEGVKKIGKGCFTNCTSLVEAVVPDTCEKLGSYAFYNCKEMTTATIGITTGSVKEYTFYNCTKLNTVVIGISVKEIGDYAFYNCALERVTVPAAVTKIGDYAFGNNKVMTRATLRKNLLTIGEGAFQNCEKLATASIPTSVISIGRFAFENCMKLPSVIIPVGVTTLNDFVFSNCSSLASVTFNSNITRIGESAFYNNAFTAITLPETVETIEKSAFRSCTKLISIQIPNATKTIDDFAFLDCTALATVSLPDNVQSVGSAVFVHNNDLTAEIRYLTGTVANSILEKQDVCHVVMDENITKVGNLAFAYCYDLKDITYGDNKVSTGDFLFSANIKQLGSEVFKDATLLKNLIIPDTIQTIGDNAFYNAIAPGYRYNTKDVTVTFYYVAGDIAANILKNQRIAHVYLNDNIKTIGNNAFNSSPILETVSLPDTITTCGTSVFANSSGNVAAYFRGVDGMVDEEVYKSKTAGLTYLLFDENIDIIGGYAYYGATTVKGVFIKDTDTIKDHAFANSSSIYGVVIENAELIDDYAFNNDAALNYVEIGQAVTIDDYAFAECIALKRLELDSIVNINEYAFYDCIAMNYVYIDADLVYIGDHAFEECKLIPEIKLPNTVREIGAYAFYNCNSMANINIPIGITAINSHTFFGCASLLKIHLPDSVKKIDDYAYYGCVLVNDLTIGNAVMFIGEYAFYNCNKVSRIIIPETVVTIEDYAFRGCTSIKEIYLPDSVTTLGDCVFYACVGLEKVEFGIGITSIGDRVFYACVNLIKLIVNSEVDYINDLAFYGAEDVIIYTPYNEYAIEYCGDNGIGYVITSHAHIYNGEGEMIKAPTCTQGGTKKVFCVVAECGEYQTVTIPALGHNFGEWQITKEATYTEDGEKTHSCSRCGLAETERIPKLSESHTHYFTGREEVIKEPTCTESGVKRIYCTGADCAEYTTETIPPLGHLEGEWTVETAPSCTETGLEVKKCTRCGIVLQSRTIEATGHTWNSGVVTKEPTCTADGVKTFTCTTCGYTITKPIPATGHTPGEWETTKEATCTENGTKVRHCTVCGDIVSEDIIPATGHQYGEWTITIHPSETTPGEKERTCSVCGHKETQAIDPAGVVPTITIDDIKAHLDEEITVNVDIADNPGIISMSLKIGYDNDVLELLSASAVDFADLSFGPTTANPFVVTWEDVLSGNNSTNGTFVQLKFKVKSTATVDSTQITIFYDEDNVFNDDFDNVFFDVHVGEIQIVHYMPGDVNRDGKVNLKDYALLKQYINGWEVDIELSVADVTGDGKINLKDYALLKQYINGWEVELK